MPLGRVEIITSNSMSGPGILAQQQTPSSAVDVHHHHAGVQESLRGLRGGHHDALNSGIAGAVAGSLVAWKYQGEYLTRRERELQG
jgi:hypothetical protein